MIIVASVSCIYGLGSPEYYAKMVIPVEVGQHFSMDKLITRLVEVHYERNDYDFHRGTFRVRGDALEIIPAYHHERALRLEFLAMTSTLCAKLTPYGRGAGRCEQNRAVPGQPLCFGARITLSVRPVIYATNWPSGLCILRSTASLWRRSALSSAPSLILK